MCRTSDLKRAVSDIAPWADESQLQGHETLGPCLAAKARREPLPENIALAVLVYGDHLAVEMPAGEDERDALEQFTEVRFATPSMLIEHVKRPRKVASKPTSRTPRKT